jgi:hypothetical protein
MQRKTLLHLILTTLLFSLAVTAVAADPYPAPYPAPPTATQTPLETPTPVVVTIPSATSLTGFGAEGVGPGWFIGLLATAVAGVLLITRRHK